MATYVIDEEWIINVMNQNGRLNTDTHVQV